MSNLQCRKTASLLIKDRYGEGFFAVMLCLETFFILKILDVAFIGFLLYNNGMDTESLFFSSFWWELALKILSAALTLVIMTPLITGGLWWFYETASGGDNKSILKLYAGARLNVRAAGLYALMGIRSLLSLLPSGVCFAAAVMIYKKTSLFEDQALMLFISLQAFMVGIFLLGLFLRCLTKMFLAPFVFMECPDMNIFKILKRSGRAIYGAKLECLKLIMTYFLPMLPIITVPFVLPKALMSFSVFAREKLGGYCKKC